MHELMRDIIEDCGVAFENRSEAARRRRALEAYLELA